jgi:brefeldin A-inhibited guanine nucleotide-exchange protein
VEKRERDGIARVRLPWGEVYMPVKELLPAARPERAGLEHSATKPKEGLNARRLEWMRSRLSDGLLPFNEQRVFTQCKVQLELLPALGDVIKAGFPRLLCRHFDVLLDCMTSSYRVAADFNADKRYRSALAQAGFMRHLNLSKLPNLLRQETAALVQVLRVLFRLYSEAPPSGDSAGLRGAWLERQALASRRITDVCSSAVKRYVELDGAVAVAGAGGSPSQVEEGRMVLAFTPILVQILTGFLRVRERQFASHVGWLYPLLVELVQCGSRDLRCVLREILALRVRPLLEQATLEKR